MEEVEELIQEEKEQDKTTREKERSGYKGADACGCGKGKFTGECRICGRVGHREQRKRQRR